MPKAGSGRVFLRGGIWWIDYSFRGRRVRESTGSTRKKAAVELLRKRMAEMGAGRLIGPTQERVLFEDLAAMITTDYQVNGRRSLPRLELSLRHLEAHFGAVRAVDITTDRIKAYVANRQGEGASNSSIQKELAALKRAFRLAEEAERLSTRPFIPSVRVSNTRQGFFEVADLERVIDHLPADLGPVVRFAAHTGWRRGEVLGLRWSNVDFPGGVVRLAPGTTKNDEGREFPFSALPPLEELLKAQRERTNEAAAKWGRVIPYVFHRYGKPVGEFRKAWASACEKAGVPGALFHDLRRTAVRNLERAGVSRSVAMKLTGHKTESVYRRYAITDSTALAEGVAKLARLHDGGGAKAPRKVVPLTGTGEAS